MASGSLREPAILCLEPLRIGASAESRLHFQRKGGASANTGMGIAFIMTCVLNSMG